MSKKEFLLEDGLAVTVVKRRGNRNLRLSLGPNNQVKVSIPVWAPYKTGKEFARARKDWIKQHQRPVELLKHGQTIGKSHQLRFVTKPGVSRVSGAVRSSLVVVSHPETVDPHLADAQTAAEKACVRALRIQAEQLLPRRLASLAHHHGFEYKRVTIKRMKSRWGSCDQHKNIVLNLFLIQLPWELIDYVLMHELVHTEVLKHGPEFWQAMEARLPQAKRFRKDMCNYHPILMPAGNVT